MDDTLQIASNSRNSPPHWSLQADTSDDFDFEYYASKNRRRTIPLETRSPRSTENSYALHGVGSLLRRIFHVSTRRRTVQRSILSPRTGLPAPSRFTRARRSIGSFGNRRENDIPSATSVHRLTCLLKPSARSPPSSVHHSPIPLTSTLIPVSSITRFPQDGSKNHAVWLESLIE
ncbi:hypothetical protein AB6A40_008268 [Gnathostoma spinigerum]|uniref:Uncharacterized protein n=1 Tax=Gnathostoma spinigerum TaxID=75299 RepID=A0ABD6EWC2_9BILA